MRKIASIVSGMWVWLIAKGMVYADSLSWNDVGVDTGVSDAVSTGNTLIKWAVYLLISASLAAGAYFGIKGFMELGKSGESMGQQKGVGKLFAASGGLVAFAILIGVIYATIKKAASGGGGFF